MPGIYIAALLTSLLALAAIGTLLWQVTQREDRSLIALLLVLSLPLSMATFYLVRMPLDRFLVARLGKDSPVLTAMKLSYAPLTEEPAKLLPLLLLLVPAFRGRLTRKAVVPVAMALGLGFALGEIWLVAGFVAQDPKVNNFPFYMYGGFLGERIQRASFIPGSPSVRWRRWLAVGGGFRWGSRPR